MSPQTRLIAVEYDIEAMVAGDSLEAIAERIERMVKAGRKMALAVREFTYLERPAVVTAGLVLASEDHDGGFSAGQHNDSAFCFVRLTNGGDRIGDTTTFGFSERTYANSGNETEQIAWKRYHDHAACSDNFSFRRRSMTHVSFRGGLPGHRHRTDDQIVITRWNGDGVATEKVLGFERSEGSW